MNETDFFEVLSEGNEISGYVSFWKRGNKYYYQCVGLSGEKRCSEELYERAKRIYEKQKNGDFSEKI